MCIANHNLLQLLCLSKRDASLDRLLPRIRTYHSQLARIRNATYNDLPCPRSQSFHAACIIVLSACMLPSRGYDLGRIRTKLDVKIRPTPTEQPLREKSSEQQRANPITANSINTSSIPSEIQQHILSNRRDQDSTSVPHQLLSHSSIFRAPTADPEPI